MSVMNVVVSEGRAVTLTASYTAVATGRTEIAEYKLDEIAGGRPSANELAMTESRQRTDIHSHAAHILHN